MNCFWKTCEVFGLHFGPKPETMDHLMIATLSRSRLSNASRPGDCVGVECVACCPGHKQPHVEPICCPLKFFVGEYIVKQFVYQAKKKQKNITCVRVLGLVLANSF